MLLQTVLQNLGKNPNHFMSTAKKQNSKPRPHFFYIRLTAVNYTLIFFLIQSFAMLKILTKGEYICTASTQNFYKIKQGITLLKTKLITYSHTIAENQSNHGSAPCQQSQQGDVHDGTRLTGGVEDEALSVPYCIKEVEPASKTIKGF